MIAELREKGQITIPKEIVKAFAPAKTEERKSDELAMIFEVLKLTIKFSKYILG